MRNNVPNTGPTYAKTHQLIWWGAAILAIGRLWIGADFAPADISVIDIYRNVFYLFLGALVFAGWGPSNAPSSHCVDYTSSSREVYYLRADSQFLAVVLALVDLAVYVASWATRDV